MNKSILFCVALMIAGTTLTGLIGCTDNQRAKGFGGTVELKKPNANWELVNITWKNEDLWGLWLWYDPSTNTCHFKEDSSFGMIEGEVVIKNCSLSQLSTQAR